MQFTKASEEERESKMNLGGHGRRCKKLRNVLHVRNGMREREYVERLKRNWSKNTGTPEGESIKKMGEWSDINEEQ